MRRQCRSLGIPGLRRRRHECETEQGQLLHPYRPCILLRKDLIHLSSSSHNSTGQVEQLQVSGSEPKVRTSRPAFRAALKSRQYFSANEIAMEIVASLFKSGRQDARQIIWDNFYSRLAGRAFVQYQCYDFECVDYELYAVEGINRLFRGPQPDLRQSEGYVTFLGAAQFFGRHRRRALHTLVSEAAGIPCINLAVSGAGPEFFFAEEVLRIANGG